MSTVPAAPAVDLDTLADLCAPWCLRVVVTLGVADALAGGAGRVDDLAAAAGCDAGALAEVLGHLVGLGVTECAPGGAFALTPAGRGLLEPGRRLFLDLSGIGGRMAGAWATLPAYVRTGQPAYADAFGLPFWQDLETHPALRASFDALMGGVGHGPADPELLADGWAGVRHLVDVGGGTGDMLCAVLRSHKGMRGTLVDLPQTAGEAARAIDAAGLSDRAQVVGQSFFDPLPAGGDAYLLRKVLNDWPDAEAVAILRRCAEAAGAGGRVLVAGGVSPDGALATLTPERVLVGGRDRPLAVFVRLAGEAGLAVVRSGHGGGGRFVVECRPVVRERGT